MIWPRLKNINFLLLLCKDRAYMNLTFAIVLSIFAGFINGSFALPSKYLKKWEFENIWLNYSIWGFLICPLSFVYFMAPHAFDVYKHLTDHMTMIILAGGLAFGIGQACFAISLHFIGIGLGFLINISIGTALGALIPLFLYHRSQMFAASGIVTITAVLLILLGLVLSYVAGHRRDAKSKKKVPGEKCNKKVYYIGVFLAIIAGFCSAAQNMTFSATVSLQYIALDMGAHALVASNILWPMFLGISFVPYAIYMLFLHFKNKNFAAYTKEFNIKYFLATMIMGLFFYFSLIMYSQASLMVGELGPIICWPMFMVCIILTSNFWGWLHGEWDSAESKVKRLALKGVLLMVLAVLVLAAATHLSSKII